MWPDARHLSIVESDLKALSNGFGSSGQEVEEQDDGASDPVAKVLGKFDEAQPRDARGRWTDGSAGGEAGEAAERAAFKRTVLRTAIGGAVIAGGAIVSAASAGTVPAAVEAAVWIAENYLLGDALVTAGRHIGAHLGYDDEEVAHMLDHLAGAVGLGKAAGNAAAGERIRDRLSEVVDAALDAMIASIREAGLDADRRSAIVAALEDLRGRLTARIAHLPAPAHKAVGVEFAKRRVWRPADPGPFDRPATRRAMRAIAGPLTTALAATRSEVVAGLRVLGKLAKVRPEPDDADALRRALDAFLDALNFTDLRAAAPEVADELEAVAADAGRRALAQIGAASREELVDRVNTRAVAAARARAAEMVGMRSDADGRLVPSADARMVITEATRDRLRETIASGLERNLGLDAIAEAIEADYAFSAERAACIAEYEVASANGAASLESYREAVADGIAVRKAWWAEEGCCAVCQANADAGALTLDEAFPSGDERTPAHPSCRCVVVPVVEDDASIDKAFDPSKHPRDPDTGEFAGAGGSGRAAKRLAVRALANRAHQDVLDLGRVHGDRFTAHAGRNVDGWRHGLTAEFVRHIDRRHGPGSGDPNPIVPADYSYLPRLLRQGSVARGGKTRGQGLQGVVVRHTIRGQTYEAVLAVRKRTGSLPLHTFYEIGGQGGAAR